MCKCNATSFDGQKIYCGFDVHSQNWHICVRTFGLEVRCLQMEADVGKVIDFLHRNFCGAEIHSVYEAGFCGFGAHRRLVAAGIDNIVVNPADIPTTGKERDGKCDRTDCRKLARHLEDGSLTGIDVPSREIECLRGLCRRETQVRDATIRLGNQLKSALYFHGCHAVPGRLTEKALAELESAMETEEDYACRQEILSLVRQTREHRSERARLVETEREAVSLLGLQTSVELLTGICGIGFRTAVVLVAELGDVSRFKSRDHLASYVGLAPHAYGSGGSETDRASGSRKRRQLHYLLVQAAWVAVARDPAMLAYFGHLCSSRRMRRTRAIVSVAKKMLMIVYAVLRDRKPYRSEELFERNPSIRPVSASAGAGRIHAAAAESAAARLADPEDGILGETVQNL